MPRGPSGNVSFTAKISRREAAILDEERARRGLPTVSAVAEAALLETWHSAGSGTRPAEAPRGRGPVFVTTFRFDPSRAGADRQAGRRYGLTVAYILRAAIGRRRVRRSGPDPDRHVESPEVAEPDRPQVAAVVAVRRAPVERHLVRPERPAAFPDRDAEPDRPGSGGGIAAPSSRWVPAYSSQQ